MVKDGIIKVKVFGKDKNDKRDNRSVVQLENRLTVSIPESMIYISEFEIWFGETQNPIRTLINMLQFGYDVEEEKCYKIKLKSSGQYLLRNPDEDTIFFGDTRIFSRLTKWQLEESGFGWVFDCEGIEIEEIE